MDVIKQLIGETNDWDQVDTFLFVFYNPSKFSNKNVNVDLVKGIVEVWGEEKLEHTFNIIATLQ